MTSDLAFAGLDEHLRLLAAGQTTSEELTALFLDRIERYDPAVNAYRAVFGERARAEAAQADARRRAGDRGAGLRRRGLDPDPRRGVRAVRPQAGARPRADGADVRAVARAVHVGPDHAARGRQRPNLRRH